MQLVFTAVIENRKLRIVDQQLFSRHLENLAYKTKARPVDLIIRPKKKYRTHSAPGEKSNENGYYWAVVIPILCAHFGYAPDEMHEALKFKFLRIGGTDALPKIKSSTQLSTFEWEEFMERIRVWANQDFNVYIPCPNEVYEG